MNFYDRFSKIEKKANSLSKIKRIEEIKKENESISHNFPKIPADAFSNIEDYFRYELQSIHPFYQLTVSQNDILNFKSTINNCALFIEIFTTINQIYLLTMPINIDEINNYNVNTNDKFTSIEFEKNISHIKNQKSLDSYLKNIIPKIHQNLESKKYKSEISTFFELGTKSRKLSVKIKIFNTPNNIERVSV